MDPFFSIYLKNELPKGKVHGYFTLLNNIVKNLPDEAIIVELGNREGLSTLSIYEALKPNQKFYTIDIEKDLRLLPESFFNDERVIILYDNCLNDNILSLFKDKSIDLLFSDTTHTYNQINLEYDSYRNKMKDESILLVDVIKLNDRGVFFDRWDGEKYSLDSWAHESGFGCFKINNV
jgi:predicted O-methyltransferase YrrM